MYKKQETAFGGYLLILDSRLRGNDKGQVQLALVTVFVSTF
jgi:hypothetical protein